MIKYTLRCSCEHEFEEWFSSSTTYDDMATAGELSCPVCGGHSVCKAVMAPSLGRSSAPEPAGCPAFNSGACPAGCSHAHH